MLKLKPTPLGARRRTALLASTTLPMALLVLGAASQPSANDAGYTCVSRPSDVRDLGFSIRGKVAELSVRPGQVVRKGDLLVRLDDSVQKQIVEFTRLQSQDKSNIQLAQSDLEYRTKEVELIEQALANQASNDAQLREARYRVSQARITLGAATTQQQLRATELGREQSQLDLMQIQSPIDGTILDIRKRAGETVDEGTPVMTILTVDPLWLDASVPIRDAAGISLGQVASVVFEDTDDKAPMTGTVIYKSPAGNAGARQVQIRVEVKNPGRIPSGMHGRVTLTKPSPP